MNFLNFDAKKLALVICIVVIPLFIINMERNNPEIPWYIRPFTFFTGLIQDGYSSFSSGIRGTTGMYLNLLDIKTNNRELTQENAELRAKLGALTELKLENERLNSLLGFKQKTDMELLAAKVVGRDLIPDHNTITINRGTKHGLRDLMAAITVSGVVGYVFRAELFTSQILLLTDRYAAIDAIVQRSRTRGIIEGKSRESCQLKYLERNDDVKEGDLVVTSGLDKIFPKGFPVGTVKKVIKSRYGMSQDVEVETAVNPHVLEEVFIVLNTNDEDFSPEPEKDEESESNEDLQTGSTPSTTKQVKPDSASETEKVAN